MNSTGKGKVKLSLFYEHFFSQTYDYDKLQAGDWLQIVGWDEDNSDCQRYMTDKSVIVKVISCKVKSEFWSGTPGEMTVEFPNGEREKLTHNANCGNCKVLWKYFDKKRFYDDYYLFAKLYAFKYTDRIVLKQDLEKYHSRIEQDKADAAKREREKRIAEQKAQQEQLRREEEQRRRNASVSDAELDAAFHGKSTVKKHNKKTETSGCTGGGHSTDSAENKYVKVCKNCGKVYGHTGGAYDINSCSWCSERGEPSQLAAVNFTIAERKQIYRELCSKNGGMTSAYIVFQADKAVYDRCGVDSWPSINKKSINYKRNIARFNCPADKTVVLCPNCNNQILRLPLGKGKIIVYCPNCETDFETST